MLPLQPHDFLQRKFILGCCEVFWNVLPKICYRSRTTLSSSFKWLVAQERLCQLKKCLKIINWEKKALVTSTIHLKTHVPTPFIQTMQYDLFFPDHFRQGLKLARQELSWPTQKWFALEREWKVNLYCIIFIQVISGDFCCWTDVGGAIVSEGDFKIKVEFWLLCLIFLWFLEMINYYCMCCDFTVALALICWLSPPSGGRTFFLECCCKGDPLSDISCK